MSNTIIQAHGLAKKYGHLEVLKGVDFSAGEGEFISVSGPSGAGKSTLLHLLGALDKPDAGSVQILDKDVFRLSGKEQASFRNKNMGFVFQFHHLLPEFTALENVCMPLWIAGLRNKEAEDKAAEMLEKVGLSERIRHKPGELSGGEQQRVAIARAIVNGPRVVFADEPTGNLDVKNAVAVHELFLALSRELHQTVIVVTHNPDFAKMADRQLKMQDGRFIE